MTALKPAVRALIEGTNYAHLATILPDGAPHAVPVWVAMDGDRVVFQTSPRSRKARNVVADPRVALSIIAQDRPNTMGQIRGRVVETVEGDRGWAIIDRLSEKYLGMPYPLREDRAAFVVEPEHSFFFAAG